MRGKARRPIIAAFLLVLIGLLLLLLIAYLWPPGMGSGSMRYARKWERKLAACESLDDVRKKFNCGRHQATPYGSYLHICDPNTYKKGNTWALLYDLPNGDWLALAYASSHGARGGGTVVTRDNSGRIRVFFGHVCGTPWACGESLDEVYASFDDLRWKEVSSGD
ncbi:MAG: hypothetical protein ACYS8I_04785 [Planctomycetota bacterium]|jgi:hypothetical protein